VEIGRCSAEGIITVFASNSKTPEQVRQEVEGAVSTRSGMMPARIENGIPAGAREVFLPARHWLDAPEAPLEAKLDQPAETIRSIKRQHQEVPCPV